jgi:uncharacterized membrane protein YraQ (UPF0718 family)
VFAVVLGLLALGIGPLIGPWLRRSVSLAAGVDGFVVTAVCGLVLLHVMPQSVALAGGLGFAMCAFGFLVPVLLHRLDAQRLPAVLSGSREVVTVIVVVAGVFIHAFLDGVALVGGDTLEGAVDVAHGGAHGHDHHDHAAHGDDGLSILAIAVLLHRLPYSLAIWLVGRERLGTARAVGLLVALGGGTVVGAIVGAIVGDVASDGAGVMALALVQAFAAGAVLHVLFDAPAFDVSSSPRASAIGVVVALAVLVWLTRSHPVVRVAEEELQFGATLWTLAVQSAPTVLVSLVVLGVLGVVGPRLRPRVGVGRWRVVQAVSGVVAGAVLPVCSCAAVSSFEGLVRRRVAAAAAVAFLVAAPALGVPSLLLSFELLGAPLALGRIVGAVVTAVVAGVVVAVAIDAPAGEGSVDLPAQGFRQAFVASVDHVAPWLLLGIVVAAFAEPLLSPTMLGGIPGIVEVPLAALLGVPLYVCATGSTPIVMVLVHKGLSAGAAVAFLLAGPAVNIATLGLMSRLLTRKAAVAFVVAVVGASSGVGLVINAVGDADALALPGLHALAAQPQGPGSVAALGIVAVVLLASMARQGARGFLGQIVRPLDEAMGGHVHGPHCGHKGYVRPRFGARPAVASIQLDFKPVPRD